MENSANSKNHCSRFILDFCTYNIMAPSKREFEVLFDDFVNLVIVIC